MAYQKKLLPDGTTNPKFKGDRRQRNGDRHKSTTGDRHKPRTGDRHTGNRYRGKDHFIAIDGEAVMLEDGTQQYILMMSSNDAKPLYNPHTGLTTKECFDWLLSLSKGDPHAHIVCFGASYDINMMFRDIPKNILEEIWQGYDDEKPDVSPSWEITTFEPVEDDGEIVMEEVVSKYTITYRPRKSLFIGKWGTPRYKEVVEHGQKKYKVNYEQTVTLWDVYGFFQCSFVDALVDKKRGYFHDYLIREGDREYVQFPDGFTFDLTQMVEMKRNRQYFTIDEWEEIARYCFDECITLQRLMERLKALLIEAGITLSRWDGAGACANYLLRQHHVKQQLQEGKIDKELYHAQLCAYAGGRMEAGKYGVHIGKIYNGDRISSYPSNMVDLPALTGGMWRKVPGASTRPYSLIHVKWSFDASLPYFPFFYRDKFASIYFPCQGENWVWKPEVDAAMKALNDGKLSTKKHPGQIEALESWEFQPASDKKPFAFIRDLFEMRKKWKEENNPAEKVLKFTINSLYGKTAQSIGGTNEKRPPFHNIGLAGYVTSCTRAKMFEVLMQSPQDIIAVTTDGLYSLCQLDVPIGESMGEWEVVEIDGIILLRDGVYWGLVELGREPTEEEKSLDFFHEQFYQHNGTWYRCNPHYRGFDRGSLTPKRVVELWKSYAETGHAVTRKISNELKSPHAYTVPSTRFITLGSGLASKELWMYWRQWRTIGRKLDIEPIGKRLKVGLDRPLAHEALQNTHAAIPQGVWMDEPGQRYKLKWEPREESLVDGVTQEIYEMEHLESEL